MFKVDIPLTLQPDNDWRDETTWVTYENGWAKAGETLAHVLFWPMTNVKLIGAENLPQHGACILAPNHISNFDPVMVGTHVPRHSFFMTKVELFRIPVVGWYIRETGSFPVYRGERDEWAMNHAAKVLEDGQMLCMFPEGTRSKTAQPRLKKGKLGTVKLALEYNVPIVPAAIWGTHNISKKNFRCPITIQIGEPLDVTQLAGSQEHDLHLSRELTTVLMERIAAMLPPENRGNYG